MESMTSKTCLQLRAVVAQGAVDAGIWTFASLRDEMARVITPRAVGYEATSLSGASRDRTSVRSQIAPTSAISLLPTSNDVVFNGFAGIRSWSPPV